MVKIKIKPGPTMLFNSSNVGKTINHPPLITINICGIVCPPSQMGGLWHCFSHINHVGIEMVVLPAPGRSGTCNFAWMAADRACRSWIFRAPGFPLRVPYEGLVQET